MSSEQTLQEYREYAEDHLEHFGYIPTLFEDSQGREYEQQECWDMAMKLGLRVPVEDT